MNNSKLTYFLIGAAAVILYISNRLWPTHGAQIIDLFYTIVLLAGVGMLVFHGTLRRSRFGKGVMIGAGALIIGIICGMLKVNGADIILLSGAGTMLIFYALHYFVKASKTILDHLKMLWLLSAIAGLVFILFDLPYAILITDIVNVLLIAMLAIFLASQPETPFTPRKNK